MFSLVPMTELIPERKLPLNNNYLTDLEYLLKSTISNVMNNNKKVLSIYPGLLKVHMIPDDYLVFCAAASR